MEIKTKRRINQMITITSQSGHTSYGLKEFIVDTENEITHLPLNVAMGSTAFVIEGSLVYMMNGQKEWVKI
jgi:hypothetical protein